MDYASLLNQQQLAAVETRSQHVRIIAGAGSGKTRVLTYRISYLISERQADPSRILAIAFTNKVAAEMKDRACKLVPDSAFFLHVSTFHSFCARFLRAECRSINYPVGFTIFDEDDQQALVKNIAVDFGYKKGDKIVKTALEYIRQKKCRGDYPEDIVIDREAFDEEKECLRFFVAYEKKKTAMFCLDFDDLLLKTIRILSENTDIREKWSHRFDHILVDEFQDTNDVQYKLMKLLITPQTNIYVVGDPDQTIYTWRGANQNIILNFAKEFPDAETIILDRNYRSTKTILDAANLLISKNKKRVPKNLYTLDGAGDPIEIKRLPNAEGEAQYVISQIERLARKSTPPEYRNIAVLYRSSYVTRPFEAEFAAHGIPYRVFGGLRFYQRMEVKDVLAYFRLLLNPLDDVSFERIANVPKRGIGDTSLETIRNEAKAANLSEYNYLLSISPNNSDLSPRVITALTVLLTKMEAVKQKLKDNFEVYSSILKDFITDIGYYEYAAEDESVDEDRAANVNALFDDITHFIANNPESTFDDYLQNVTLLTSQDDMNEGNYVSLMTIHIAKGLEFDYVFVISMNEGSFPSMRVENESGHDGKEEERRLAYVAMTRAKKKLFMTCNTGYSFVSDSHAIPSEFFEDAGLKFPPTEYQEGYGDYHSGYGHTPKGGGWKPASQGTSSFFSDGDAIDPFAKEPEPEPEAKPASNGITDWKVGDIAVHEKFGEGEVLSIIDNSIIVVNFISCGKKTLLANHPMLSRKASKGGQA